MKLYLVRHGESDANKLHLHNTPETKLTEEGILQAKALAKRLKDIKIDFIYSSSHKRTVQTAEEISKVLNIPIEKWNEIMEVKTPSVSWGKPLHDKEAIKIEQDIAKNYHKGNWKHSDEETFEEINERATKVLEHLVRSHRDQNILLVSHTSFIKMLLLSAILGTDLSPQIYWAFREHSKISNSGVTILEHNDKRGWVLVTINDISHL